MKAVEEGRKDTPKLKAPAAREKAEEAQRHAEAVAIVLSRKHDELGELLESERSQMVAAARSLSDEGLMKIRRAAEAFAKAVDSNMAKVNLPLWLESGGDILNGAQRTPDHSLMVAVRAVQDAVTDLEEGERERRQNVDRPKPEGEEVRRPAVNTSWWSPDDDIWWWSL